MRSTLNFWKFCSFPPNGVLYGGWDPLFSRLNFWKGTVRCGFPNEGLKSWESRLGYFRTYVLKPQNFLVGFTVLDSLDWKMGGHLRWVFLNIVRDFLRTFDFYKTASSLLWKFSFSSFFIFPSCSINLDLDKVKWFLHSYTLLSWESLNFQIFSF